MTKMLSELLDIQNLCPTCHLARKGGPEKKLNLPKFPLVDWNTLDQAMQYFVKDLFRYEYS